MKKKNNLTGLILAVFIVTFVLTTIAPGVVKAQEEVPPIYALVEFMKTSPEREGQYLDLELNVWKKLHQARIDRGNIVGWYLYRVHYTAANDPYNYVTVTLFADRSKMENPWEGIDPEKVLNRKDIDKMYEETMAARTMVGSNLMNRIDVVYPEGGPGDFKYLQLDYMKVKQGHERDYINTETEIWKPVHRQFIEAGSRAGWSLWGRIFPSGAGLDFQFVTVNYFSKYSQIGTANYNDAYKKSGLGMSIDEISEKTNQARLLVKSELWEVVDRVLAQ